MTGTPLSPDALAALLDVPFTDEQLTAITAPLEPGVVIAGAGSGKTTVMAARVVWLVGTGQVRPEEVLGLTFTNKAAAELAVRIRAALAVLPSHPVPAPVAPEGGAGATELPVEGEPTVATYHAYAGRLLRDHGLRIGVEPGARLLADATRFQLAERVLRRAAGPFEALDKTVSSLVGDVVALDGELCEHLVSSQRMRTHDQALRAEIAALPKRIADVAKASEAALSTHRAARRSSMTSARRSVRLGVLDFGDQLAEAVRLVAQPPGGGGGRAGALPRRPARRVPGHLGRPEGPARRAVRRRPPGDRGRRPVPGDLRLARRVGRQHRRLPRRLPARRRCTGRPLRPRPEQPERRVSC